MPLRFNPTFSRTEKLLTTGFVVLLGFIAAVAFYYVQGVILHKPFPYNTFLFRPDDHMADWGGAFQFVWNLDPFNSTYRGQGNNYPPVGYLISVPFTILGYEIGKIVFAAAFIFGWLWFCWNYVVDRAQSLGFRLWTFCIFGFLNYAFLFALDRMNAENSLFLFVMGFYVAFRAERTKAAAAFLGVAAAAKVYPGFAALLFLRRKKFVEISICAATVVASTGLALLIFRTTPQEVLEAYKRSAPGFQAPLWDTSLVQYSTSWFAIVRLYQIFFLGYLQLPPETNSAFVDLSLKYFSLFLIFPTAAMVFCSLSKKIATWELLAMAVSAMLLFTPVSFDYKLLYLIFPFASFLNSETGGKTGFAFSVLFGLLFIPKGFIVLVDSVTSNVFLNVGLLTTIFVWISVKTFMGFLRSSRGP